MRSPAELIDSTRYKAKITAYTELATRIGLTRQTLARKCKIPSTFTGGEMNALAKLLSWTDDEFLEFVKGCKGR